MSNLYLQDKEVQTKIKRLWNENPNLAFFGKMRKCIRFYKEFCVKKAVEDRQEEMELRQRLEDTKCLLHRDQSNAGVQTLLAKLTMQVQSFQKKKG